MERASNETQEDNSRMDKKEDRWKESLVIGRMVHHMGYKRTGLPNPLSIFVTKLIYLYVNSLLAAVGMLDKRFTGKVLPCGSFIEGSKIGHPDEYDFMYELDKFSASNVRLECVPPVTFSPKREGDMASRGYFRLFPCSHVESMDTERCIQLESSSLQQDFHSALKTAASQWNYGILNLQETECNGPAVTLYVTLKMCEFKHFITNYGINVTMKDYASDALKQCKTMDNRTIKLDIAPAIRVLLTEDEIRQADIDVVDCVLQSGNLDCHVVPSGDFWKLSLAQHEARLLMKLCGVKWKRSTQDELEYQPNMGCYGNDDDLRPLLHQDDSASTTNFVPFKQQIARRHCLKSLKYIRDMLDTSTVREPSLLASYLLKVSFIHECLEHPSESSWAEEQMGRRVFNILDRIETKGKEGTLTSCFMTNVPVLREGNKCYLESRRVKGYMKEFAGKTVKRFCLHTVILAFQLAASFSTLWAALEIIHCPTGTIAWNGLNIAILISGIIQFCFGLLGTLWYACNRLLLAHESESYMLYRIFSSPLLLHIVLFIIPVCCFPLQFIIMSSKDTTWLKQNGEFVIIGLQSVFCVIVLFHLLFVCIKGKGRMWDRCSEFIFADHFYADCFLPNRYNNERTYTHYFSDAFAGKDGPFYV